MFFGVPRFQPPAVRTQELNVPDPPVLPVPDPLAVSGSPDDLGLPYVNDLLDPKADAPSCGVPVPAASSPPRWIPVPAVDALQGSRCDTAATLWGTPVISTQGPGFCTTCCSVWGPWKRCLCLLFHPRSRAPSLASPEDPAPPEVLDCLTAAPPSLMELEEELEWDPSGIFLITPDPGSTPPVPVPKEVRDNLTPTEGSPWPVLRHSWSWSGPHLLMSRNGRGHRRRGQLPPALLPSSL